MAKKGLKFAIPGILSGVESHDISPMSYQEDFRSDTGDLNIARDLSQWSFPSIPHVRGFFCGLMDNLECARKGEIYTQPAPNISEPVQNQIKQKLNVGNIKVAHFDHFAHMLMLCALYALSPDYKNTCSTYKGREETAALHDRTACYPFAPLVTTIPDSDLVIALDVDLILRGNNINERYDPREDFKRTLWNAIRLYRDGTEVIGKYAIWDALAETMETVGESQPEITFSSNLVKFLCSNKPIRIADDAFVVRPSLTPLSGKTSPAKSMDDDLSRYILAVHAFTDSSGELHTFGHAPRNGKVFVDVSREQGNRSLDAIQIAIATQLWNFCCLLVMLAAATCHILSFVFVIGLKRAGALSEEFSVYQEIMRGWGYRDGWETDSDSYAWINKNGKVDSAALVTHIKKRIERGDASFSVFVGHAHWMRIYKQGNYYVCLSHDRVEGDLSVPFYMAQTEQALNNEQITEITKLVSLHIDEISHIHRDHLPTQSEISNAANKQVFIGPRGSLRFIQECMRVPAGSKLMEAEWGTGEIISFKNNTQTDDESGEEHDKNNWKIGSKKYHLPTSHWSQSVAMDKARYSSSSHVSVVSCQYSETYDGDGKRAITRYTKGLFDSTSRGNGPNSSPHRSIQDNIGDKDRFAAVEVVLGDTAMPTDWMIDWYAASIAHEIIDASDNNMGVTIDIVMPCGPNRHRRNMASTHMSCVDTFLLTTNIVSSVSRILQHQAGIDDGLGTMDIMKLFRVFFYHHGKYRLGNDKEKEWYFCLKNVGALIEELKSLHNKHELIGSAQNEIIDCAYVHSMLDRAVHSAFPDIANGGLFEANRKFVLSGFSELLCDIILNNSLGCPAANNNTSHDQQSKTITSAELTNRIELAHNLLEKLVSEVFFIPKIGSVLAPDAHFDAISHLTMAAQIAEFDKKSSKKHVSKGSIDDISFSPVGQGNQAQRYA